MKYEPLEEHLKAQAGEALQLSFAEIEFIIDARLPASARKFPAWWSNNPTNHVNAQAWLEAGFRTEQVDLAEETVVFRRAGDPAASQPRTGRHPAWGALKDTVKVAPGVDLAQPLLEPWGGEEW